MISSTIVALAGIIPGITDLAVEGGSPLRESHYGANFRGANLSSVDFTFSDLSWANLEHANLRYAGLFQANLSGANLRVWFADEDLKGGAKLHEQIDQAIRGHDKLVLVLSEQSIQSEWVMTEIRKARKAELRDKRRKLFPIRLVDMDTLRDWECFDADTGKDLAVEVREYFIPDFNQWKDHDSFERAFARFLKDLQATEAPPVPRVVAAPIVGDTSRDSKADAQESQSVIGIKKRRLQLLEEQQARKGHDTPVDVLMEIEDLRRELGMDATGGE